MTHSKDTLVFNGFEPANTTPVPDVLFDVLLPYLNEAQLKVMLYIIRRTLGFKKTSDAISLNQFRWGITTKDGKKLDDGCGLKNFTTISNALKELEQMNCIESDKRETDEGNKLTTVYRIRFRGTTPNVVGTTDSVVGVLRQTYDRTTPNRGRVLRQTEPQETVLQQTDTQETVIQEREYSAPESHATFSPPSVGDARAFSSSGEIDEAMIREVIAQSSLSSEGEITEEFIQRTIDAFKQSVLVELRARPGLSEHPDDQLPGKRENETQSQQGGTDALLDSAGRLPAVGTGGTGVGRGSEDIRPRPLQQPEGQGEIDNTFLEKGHDEHRSDHLRNRYHSSDNNHHHTFQSLDDTRVTPERVANLPTSTPAQPLPPGTEQAASELVTHCYLCGETASRVPVPGPLVCESCKRKARKPAQQNHGAGSPCGAMVGDDLLSNPPAQEAPSPKGRGKKAAEPAPKCDTKEIQRRIDEHRGYALEERVEIIRERGAVKTWCNLHTLEEYTLVMDGLKNDPYWGKAENYYRVGGLTLLKETGRVLALKATQYKPALKVVKRYSSYDDPNFRSDQDFYPVEGGSYAAASY